MNTVSDTDFQKKVLDYEGVSVIDFWAEWCGPCRMFGPFFEAASKEVTQAQFLKMNVDESQQVAQDLGIRSIPTVVFFKDGQEVKRFSGVVSKEELVAQVKGVL